MRPGTFLVDSSHREQRFRVKELLHRGPTHQIALAQDTHLDDKLVCCKTFYADANQRHDLTTRRHSLRQELMFLTQGSHLLPEPLDWLEVDAGAAGQLPVLVYEYQHGESLCDLVKRRFPTGLEPLRALLWLKELTRFAASIHAQGYLYRCFDPRHIIVGLDDVIHLVGCGSAIELKEQPNPAKFSFNAAYVAPELRHERSGKTQTPAADVYSLGALLSFMLTGREPQASTKDVLDAQALARLGGLRPAGLELLVLRCTQPTMAKRFARVDQMLEYLEPSSLPSRDDPDFAQLSLARSGQVDRSAAQHERVAPEQALVPTTQGQDANPQGVMAIFMAWFTSLWGRLFGGDNADKP